jgi:hypothetical protein
MYSDDKELFAVDCQSNEIEKDVRLISSIKTNLLPNRNTQSMFKYDNIQCI